MPPEARRAELEGRGRHQGGRGRHNVARGRHIFQWHEARGVTLLHYSSIGDGLHYPMRNADEESGRLLDNNGCPAVNPSSESPPQFASEESVPMMLHTATETEVGCKS